MHMPCVRSMTVNSSRKHQCDSRPRALCHTTAASQSHLSELGTEVVATRLLTLGHPMRLRIMGALNGRSASADHLGKSGLGL